MESSSSLPTSPSSTIQEDNKHLFNHSDIYSLYRPQYPDSLFTFLASLCKEVSTSPSPSPSPSPSLAWDVATGNGQAAIGLAKHFDKIIATDVSSEQIARAKTTVHFPNIEFQVSDADKEYSESGLALKPNSVDIVTVACGLHWLDRKVFYRTVYKVLKKGKGVFAAWGFTSPRIEPEVDKVVEECRSEVHKYRRRDLEVAHNQLKNIDFPFQEIPVETGRFNCEMEWNVDDCIGWLSTLSSSQLAKNATGRDLVQDFQPALVKAWGCNREVKKKVVLPLYMRVGLVKDQY